MRIALLIFSMLLIISDLFGQIDVTLNWYDTGNLHTQEDSVQFLNFEGAENATDFGLLPQYYTSIPLENDGSAYQIELGNLKWEAIPLASGAYFQGKEFIADSAIVQHFIGMSRKKRSLDVSVIPLRRSGDAIECLTSFRININKTASAHVQLKSSQLDGDSYFKSSSVLASGKWVKMAIKETGMYRLTYGDISGMGLDPATVKVFGNGGEVLDRFIANYKNDDLNEVPLWVEKGSDGVFNSGDYILFYAHGTYKWYWDATSKEYKHKQHPFSDEAYYFVTSDAGALSEVTSKPDTISLVNDTIKTFIDYAVYEPMERNLLESGSEWFDDPMGVGQTKTLSFSFDKISLTDDARVYVSYAARSIKSSSSVRVSHNNDLLGSISVPLTTSSEIGVFAYRRNLNKTFRPESGDIEIDIQLNNFDASATGWIDYVRLNVVRPLELTGDELHFRYPYTLGAGEGRQFSVEGADENTIVLDVSDRHAIEKVNTTMVNGTLIFKDDASVIRSYVALNPKGSFPKPGILGEVKNQNLHGQSQVDMVILSHPDFLGEGMAQDLYELRTAEGLDVLVVTPQEIYNEFSGGQPDNTAIRWFMKMLYDRSGSEDDLLKYLLILGDGTFDNRPGVNKERSKIITFQSDESLHQANTYVSDDYFAILDDTEGSLGNSDKVDIGVGRFPVYTVEQARAMVSKTKYYYENRNRSMWKNTVCFVADDGDHNIHMRDANLMADKVAQLHPELIVDKILIDAYQQVVGASGPTYPDASNALEKNLQQGVLLLNYSGHGGITGLTDEKMVTKNMIKALENLNNLPVWVTATCEFSRFDMDEGTSAGEWVLLSSEGGGVSLFTTTRLVFSSSNYTINNNFFDYAFTRDANGEPLRLGDICRETKSHTGTGANKRKFMLLGDPALAMLEPDLKVKTLAINDNKNFLSENDTISALESVSIKGYIEDESGDTATFFNGEVYVKVYDKISSITTLMNDAGDYNSPLSFDLWDKAIFNGKTEVKDGYFELEFMIPKEINYAIGKGRIVYYASSEDYEAKGYSEDLKIGGFNENFVADDDGPDVDLFLNSPGFVNGASVSSNPLFMADIMDQSGINTSGVGVGHDIVLILDNDPNQTYVLNDYFEPLVGASQGQVKFKLNDLETGEHTLFFRVWDIYNNSASATLKFIVDVNDKPDVVKVTCYPNPATSVVNFEFDHNRPESVLDIHIDIFSTNGQLINTLSEFAYSSGNTFSPVVWDLKDLSGRSVDQGIYIYRVRISSDGKESLGKAQKLIVQ